MFLHPLVHGTERFQAPVVDSCEVGSKRDPDGLER